MDDLLNKAIPFVLIAAVGFGLYLMVAETPYSVDGNVPIDTKVVPRAERGYKEPDKTYVFTHHPSGDKLYTDLYDNELLLRPNQTTRTAADGSEVQVWTAEGSEYRYFADYGLDIGIVAAIETGRKDDTSNQQVYDFDLLLRVSFVRYLDNHVAPDFLVSNQAVGFGVAYFPAPNTSHRFLRHIGLELGYVYTPRDDRWRVLLGVATEFKF